MAEVLDKKAKIEVGEKLNDSQITQLLAEKQKQKDAKKEQIAPPVNKVEPPAKSEPAPLPAAKVEPPATPAKQEEKKPEPKAETPPAEKPEIVKPKNKVKETLTSFFDKKISNGEEPKPKGISQEEYDSLKKELDDPAYKIIKEAKANGKDLFEILEEIKGVDPAQMSEEQLYRYELSRNGITQPEEQDAEWESFQGMSKLSQKKEIEAIKRTLTGDREQRIKEFYGKVSAPDPNQKLRHEQAQRDAVEFSDTITSFIDKEVIPGVVFTKDIAQKIIDRYAKNEAMPKKADGSIDAQALITRDIKAEMFDLCMETLSEHSKAEGIQEILNEVEATPNSRTQVSRPPEPIHKLQKGDEEYGKKVSSGLVPL